MKKIFEAIEFYNCGSIRGKDAVHLANYCNEKIEKLMADWPVVIREKNSVHEDHKAWRKDDKGYFYEHFDMRARLAFIEPIKRECKHEPNQIWTCNNHPLQKFICSKCNIELEAEWKVKGEK